MAAGAAASSAASLAGALPGEDDDRLNLYLEVREDAEVSAEVQVGVLTELEEWAEVRFIDSLEMLSHSPNLGDTRTIVTHPTSTTHSKLTEEERQRVGITPGMVRVSVGLESIGDVIADVEQALSRSR